MVGVASEVVLVVYMFMSWLFEAERWCLSWPVRCVALRFLVA